MTLFIISGVSALALIIMNAAADIGINIRMAAANRIFFSFHRPY